MPTAAPSQTDIANGALNAVGSTEVLTSIDSNSHSAKRIRTAWPEVLRTLLAEHPWNFAVRRAMLVEDGEAPQFGYKRRFRLPADALRILPFARDDDNYRKTEREGAFMLADEPGPMPIRYIALIEDTSQWAPHFATAMKFALAATIAEGVTQSESIKQDMQRAAEDALMDAKRRDGLETTQVQRGRPIVNSRWVAARRSPYAGDGLR